MKLNQLIIRQSASPCIIYGTSSLGNLYREMAPDEKTALMREWFRVENGTVMIDSAGKYGAGLALEVIGRGLESLGVRPDQVTISNKLGWYRIPLKGAAPAFEPGVWANLPFDAVQKISYSGILECWEQGCRLLGGKYKPALVSVHDPDEYLAAATGASDRSKRLHDILGAYRALFELKEKGEVKAVGIGSKDWLVIRGLYREVRFDWVMFANQFTVYRHSPELIRFMDELCEAGTEIINSGVFNAGFLTGGDYFDYRIIRADDPADQPLFLWRENFFAVCDRFGIAPGDACLKFAVSAPQIAAVALNPGKPSRMVRNRQILVEEFDPAFWRELKDQGIIDPAYPYL